MKIIKNSQKTKDEGCGVWTIIASVSEISLLVFVITVVAMSINYYLNHN